MRQDQKSATQTLKPERLAWEKVRGELIIDAYEHLDINGRTKVVSKLFESIYSELPTSKKMSFIKRVLTPISLLSLFGVANGTFARLKFSFNTLPAESVLDDLQNVQPSGISQLVEHALSAGGYSLEVLAGSLGEGFLASGSAAAAILVAILIGRSLQRRGSEFSSSDQSS